jgi:hypothetical protein
MNPMSLSDLPITPSLKKALVVAGRMAKNRGDKYVGVAHLCAALAISDRQEIWLGIQVAVCEKVLREFPTTLKKL